MISPVVAGNQSERSATHARATGSGIVDVPAERGAAIPCVLEQGEARDRLGSHRAHRTGGKSIPGFALFEDIWDGRAPLGWEITDPEPVAGGVVALLSDWFPATTGEIVHVDGGFHSIGAGRGGRPATGTRRRRRRPTCANTATTPWTGTRGAPRRSPRPAERDVPVLLSVGYSACHWCHVMAHESFEDDGSRRR